MSADLTVTERTRLRRLHERGHFDPKTIYSILDAMPLCHVGYLVDGKPAVTPTFQWREGDTVYWHGSSASRAIRSSTDADVCLTVTLLDGFVLARSAFHHSANFRSVMIYGRATKVADPSEKEARLRTFVEILYPGRWDELRPMTDQEAKATTVLSMPIDEASAKIRTGQPVDDEADYALPVWAGVVPAHIQLGEPLPDPRLRDTPMPGYVRDFSVG
jgi:nitroimidazol reductase NimA-like FMN-containing flavoprotein (pyridoxamine 5'-phosphate oxidase superfamily)